MKKLIPFVLIFGISPIVSAGDTASPPTATNTPATADNKAAPSADNKAAAVAVAAPLANTMSPAAPVAAAASLGAALVAAATQGANPAAESKPAPAAKTVDAVPELKTLLDYHQKQIDILKQFAARWNGLMGSAAEHRQNIEGNITATEKQLNRLTGADDKAGKREIARLNKEMNRLDNALKGVDRELEAQRRELVSEVKDMSGDAQQGLKESYRDTIKDFLKPQN